MRSFLSPAVGLLSVVLIAISSVQLAAARGQSPAVGTMVICSGSGPLMVLVDETGQPTGGVMVCPDYALSVFADMDSAAPEAVGVPVWRDLWSARTVSHGRAADLPRTQPRGPPLSV